MVTQNDTLQRSHALSSIPERKLLDALKKTIDECELDRGKKPSGSLCDKCRLQNIATNRYAESNIPVEYWDLSMDEDFVGFDGLRKKYDEVTADVQRTYGKGVSVCFAGPHGTGKTMTCCCLLKKAALVGYSCLYVTLGDIVNLTGSGSAADRFNCRKELMMVDFLVIDEFDPRWMATDSAADFYGRTLEDVFRARLQNKLPTFMCTNHPKVTDSFTGALKKSIESLMRKMETVPVLGKDFRGKGSK